ncbi:MAG: plastocyanin/azurin family copper-binding protein, partial [Nanoarchaeota archaeon]
IIALIALMIISCGTKTETTTETAAETSAEESSVTVATQPVLTEESAAVEETVVVDSSDASVAVDVTSGASGVSVDVSTEEVSVSVDEEETQAAAESQAADVEVKIESYSFDEKTITVKAGTTVIWENYDSAPHTVTGDGLDSGKMSKGDTYEYTFTEPGTYEYYCAYHPSMVATVIVE